MPQFKLIGRDDPRIANADAFTVAYIEAALFTEEEELGGSGTVAVQQLSDQLLHTMREDCVAFAQRALPIFMGPISHRNQSQTIGGIATLAGHDFWLTRNGHGSGFWDGDWSEPAGSKLDEIAKAFPQVDLYRGRDGRIYS